jgi:cobalt-zinc-cadmium efflux system membrane fusion protein
MTKIQKKQVKLKTPHEEETPTIATLTEEQIKTVGIQLGVSRAKRTNGNYKSKR